MTGYAVAARQDEGLSLSVELRGYNSRFLDIVMNLPPFLAPFEGRIREYLAGRFRRGKIELSLKCKEYYAGFPVRLNREAVRAYAGAIGLLAAELGSSEKPPLPVILGLEGVLEIGQEQTGEQRWDRIEPALWAVLGEAADQFETERLREGSHTEAAILGLLAGMEDQARCIEKRAPEMEAVFQENLRRRFAELLGEAVDEGRVLQETAVLLVKYSIAEEIFRLKAHFQEFRIETERAPSPGRKLDFLCQEINREINTIGSKVPDLEVSRAVVAMKDALEDIREQLRNVE
jgi:uncharacterized protein (TIGR00255 family)